MAPGSRATKEALSDPARRPPRAREDLSEEVRAFQPRAPFVLDQDTFLECLRTAKRGAAGGPSGMTIEHIRSLLESPNDSSLLFRAAEELSRGNMPDEVIRMLRMGRMTALQKPRGGVRGIVAGDIVRRLVSRAMAKQLGEAFEQATAPYQYALSTRAGCECVSHVLQGLTDLDAHATVMSIDGIGAYDSISRRAMLDGLRGVSDGVAVPFVRQFYGVPSQYIREDDEGIVHDISQGEGGVECSCGRIAPQ